MLEGKTLTRITGNCIAGMILFDATLKLLNADQELMAFKRDYYQHVEYVSESRFDSLSFLLCPFKSSYKSFGVGLIATFAIFEILLAVGVYFGRKSAMYVLVIVQLYSMMIRHNPYRQNLDFQGKMLAMRSAQTDLGIVCSLLLLAGSKYIYYIRSRSVENLVHAACMLYVSAMRLIISGIVTGVSSAYQVVTQKLRRLFGLS